jgi:hypothetical protein
MLSLEALQAARQIRIAGCPEEERAKLVALMRALQMLITPISRLLSDRERLPEITGQILKLHSEHLEIKFNQMLDAFAECFRQGNGRLQLPTVPGALTAMVTRSNRCAIATSWPACRLMALCGCSM